MATSDSSIARSERFREPIDPWSVPVFWVRGFTVAISYLSFAMVAIVVGITLHQAALGPGGETLAAAALGLLFWFSGWLVQGLALVVVARVVGAPIRRVTFGLFGVKLPARLWSVGSAAAVGLAMLAALMLLGSCYGLVSAVGPIPAAAAYRESLWTPPSIGLTEYDSPWRAGAWICWFQALLQTVPVGQSIGRQLIGVAVMLVWPDRAIDLQIRVFRRVLTGIAIAFVVLAIWLQAGGWFARWPLVMAVGVAIWMGARSRDVSATLQGFDQHRRQVTEAGMRATARELIRQRRQRRKAKRALVQERGEAEDEVRLDEVLDRLNREGADALTREDRKLLQRVSERVRRQRDADSSSG